MKREIICGIYKITSPSGKVYIGQSQNIYKRWDLYKLLFCKGQIYLYNSIKKHGWDNHKKEIIHVVNIYNKEELNQLEKYYGELYNCTDRTCGLNIRECGGSQGMLSNETKLKISISNTGKKMSPESIEKTRQSNIGRKQSPKTIALIASKIKGKKQSPETIARRVLKCIGKKRSAVQCERMSIAQKGKKRNPLSIAKMAQTKRKIILNTETGIFYMGKKDASESIGMNIETFGCKLNGHSKNNTSFIKV